jgi:hypothetical protein
MLSLLLTSKPVNGPWSHAPQALLWHQCYVRPFHGPKGPVRSMVSECMRLGHSDSVSRHAGVSPGLPPSLCVQRRE